MAVNILPDRERRHLLQFYFVPRMGYRTRMGLAGTLILAGIAVQLLSPFHSVVTLLICSLPLLLVGNLFLLVRGYNLKPSHRLQDGEWEKTTRDRFREACQMEAKVKRWDETFADLTCISGVCSLLLLALVSAVVCVLLALQAGTRYWAPVFVADAVVLLIPHWITGTRRGWRPTELIQQVQSLETALSAIERFETPPCQIQPMFQLAGSGPNRTPVAARVFIRFPDGSPDFLGVQFQVALNAVQGTKYPYLYAVIVAKQPFGLLSNHLYQVTTSAFPLTVEPSREEDVEVIVIRQTTTKTSGYHTDRGAIRHIATSTWENASRILAAAPVLGGEISG